MGQGEAAFCWKPVRKLVRGCVCVRAHIYVCVWRGAGQVLTDIADNLPVTEGAPRLISNLKRLGYKATAAP